MAHITRAIELDGPADAVHEQWLRFEECPHRAASSVTAGVRWRAEVLTLEPLGMRTRVKLRVEYEPTGDGDEVLRRRVEAVLQAFTMFRGRERAGAVEVQPH